MPKEILYIPKQYFMCPIKVYAAKEFVWKDQFEEEMNVLIFVSIRGCVHLS